MQKFISRYSTQTSSALQFFNSRNKKLKNDTPVLIESQRLIISCPVTSYDSEYQLITLCNDVDELQDQLQTIVNVYHSFIDFHKPVHIKSEMTPCKTIHFEIEKSLKNEPSKNYLGEDYWSALTKVITIEDVISGFSFSGDDANMFILPNIVTYEGEISPVYAEKCYHSYYKISNEKTLAECILEYPDADHIQVWFDASDFNNSK